MPVYQRPSLSNFTNHHQKLVHILFSTTKKKHLAKWRFLASDRSVGVCFFWSVKCCRCQWKPCSLADCWWFLCRLIKLGKTTPGFIRIFCFQYVPESTYEKNLVYETCMKTPKESFFNMVPSRLNLWRNIFIAHSITSASGLKNEISKTRGLHQQGLLYVHVNNITTIHRLIVIILKSFGGFV